MKQARVIMDTTDLPLSYNHLSRSTFTIFLLIMEFCVIYLSYNAYSFLTRLTHIYSDNLTLNTIAIERRITYMVLIGGGWVSF